MDNATKQKEEVEVLASIYGKDWIVDNEDEGLYHITIEDHRVNLTLLIEFPQTYPSDSPPYFQIVSSSLRKPDIDHISCILQDVYMENLGETVIFQWIEKIREWLQEKTSVLFVEDRVSPVHNFAMETAKTRSQDFILEEDLKLMCAQIDENVNVCEPPPQPLLVETKRPNISSIAIIHGDPITFKKSTFQGHAAMISHPKDAQVFYSELILNKKIAHATHNVQAYRIFKERNNTYEEHFEDDGEKQAGHRLLHLMQIMNVRNVMVVVSRWYGGVHLGPDRFRLINNAARQVLEKGNFIPPADGKKKK